MSSRQQEAIRQQIEQRDGAQGVVEVGTGLVDGEVVLLVVDVDEPLQAAFPQRAIADDGGRHQSKSHRLAEPVGGQLTPVQPRGEVPQRPLAAERLVDRLCARVSIDDQVDEERGVAAPRHPPLDVHVGRGEQAQFIRGH